jgi:hypothetical protein
MSSRPLWGSSPSVARFADGRRARAARGEDQRDAEVRRLIDATCPRLEQHPRARGRHRDRVAKLKDETDGPILVAGATLVHALVESDLVDELRLMVFPVAIGGYLGVFPESRQRKPQLTGTKTFDPGSSSTPTSGPEPPARNSMLAPAPGFTAPASRAGEGAMSTEEPIGGARSAQRASVSPRGTELGGERLGRLADLRDLDRKLSLRGPHLAGANPVAQTAPAVAQPR